MKTPRTESPQHELFNASSQCFRQCAHRFILAGLLLSGIGVQAQLRPSEVWRAVYDTSYGAIPNFFPVDDNFTPPLSLEEDGNLYFNAWRPYAALGHETDIVQCTQEGQLTKVTTDYPSDGIWQTYDRITAQDVDLAGRLVWTTTEPRTRTFTFPNGTKWDHNNHEIVVNYKAGVTEWTVFVEHPEVLGWGTSLNPWGARDYATFARIADNGDVLVVGRYGHDNGFNDLTDGSIVIRLRASDGQELWRQVDTTATPNVCLANDQGDIWICGGNPNNTTSSAMVRYNEHGTNLASGTTTSGPLTGAVDAEGNLYLAERYFESDYDYNSVLYEHDKIRIIKYGPDLSPLWERIHESGTYGPDISFRVTVDPTGNVVVVGTTCRSEEHRYDSVASPVEDCDHGELLALKLNGAGTWLWDGVYSTAVGYLPTDFDVDRLGNVYLCALQDFPYTTPDIWGWAAVRFASANGDIEWSLQNELPEPPTPAHGITGIAVDDSDFVYLAGTGGGFWTVQDHSDVVLVKYEQIETPLLVVNPTSLTAMCNEGDDATDSHFEVWNGGGGGAMDYVITESLDWLSVAPTSGSSSDEHDSITVDYASSGLTAGTYNGTITVSAPGAAGSPQQLEVTLVVTSFPRLAVSTNSLSVVGTDVHDPASDSFEVWNSGSSNMSYTISESTTWLNCSPANGTSVGEHDVIWVHYWTTGMAPGNYQGTITITAPGAVDSPQTIVVSLFVNSFPVIDAGGDQTVDEGSLVTFDRTFYDLNGMASPTATIWWGDGTPQEPGAVVWFPWGGSGGGDGNVAGYHVYADFGVYDVVVAVTDEYGDTAEDTVQVMVYNVAPAVDAGTDQVIDQGILASLAPATFVDPGTLDTHTATIDWGDGSAPGVGVVQESPFGPPGSTNGATGTVSGSHLYADSGIYTVTVTVTDDDGGGSSDELTISVQPQGPGSDIFIELEILGDSLAVTWPGGQGVWLEKSPSLSDPSWYTVLGSEGVSEMIVPLEGEAGFYRVAASSEVPVITQQPASLALSQNSTGLLSVDVSVSGPVEYQWNQDGTSIPGATNSMLSIEAAQPSDVGDYTVVVTRGLSSVTSSVATLVLLPPYGNLVWSPAGTFMMGSPGGELDRDEDEEPQTDVTFSQGFWVGAYEVTQQEYLDVMGSNPSHFTNSLDQPVEFLTWGEATNYCRQLTLREKVAGRIPTDYQYRLPTEAEWEYVCRAGTTNRFSYGDDPGYTELPNYAWIDTNSAGGTHDVGQKLPNPWGLYDTYGNTWEWCQDWYTNSYLGGEVTDPVGAASGQYRVVRGGSYYYGGAPCRSANRGGVEPTGARWDVGFRVVLARMPQVNLLVDPSFESGSDGRLSEWLWSGNAYQEPINARTGDHSLTLFGNWTGPWNTSFALQNLAAAAGESWTFSGYARNVTGDLLGWDNYAVLKIAWFDGPNGTGNLLQPLPGPGVLTGDYAGVESPQLTSGSTPDVWHPLTVSSVAPPGTMSVQMVILLVQPSNQAGAQAWFDDVSAVKE